MGPDDEQQLYQNALDQVELADRLGYDYAWEVEHHFLEEYSHSPAPEVFLGAASQRTKNIRLGHGIVQLTTNPPQRIAERIACLDLVSQWPCRDGHWRIRLDHRTRRLRPRHGDQARGLGRRASAASSRCSRTRASSWTPSGTRCRCATCCPSRCRSRIRRFGSHARSSKRSKWPAGAVWARLASSSCRPMLRMPGCTPTTTPSSSSRRSWRLQDQSEHGAGQLLHVRGNG